MAGAELEIKKKSSDKGTGNGPNLTVSEVNLRKRLVALGDAGRAVIDYIEDRAKERANASRKLSGLETGQDRISTQAKKASDASREAKRNVASMSQTLTTMSSNVDTILEAASETGDAVSELKGAINASAGAAVEAGVLQDTDIGDKKVGEKLTALFRGLATASKTLNEGVERRLDSLRTALSKATEAAATEGIIEADESSLQSMDTASKASALAAGVVRTLKQLKDDVTELKGLRTAFKANAPKLTNPSQDEAVGETPSDFAEYVGEALRQVWEDVLEIKGKLPTAEAVAELTIKYTGVNTELEGYNTDNVELRRQIGELESKVASLEHQLESAVDALNQSTKSMDDLLTALADE